MRCRDVSISWYLGSKKMLYIHIPCGYALCHYTLGASYIMLIATPPARYINGPEIIFMKSHDPPVWLPQLIFKTNIECTMVIKNWVRMSRRISKQKSCKTNYRRMIGSLRIAKWWYLQLNKYVGVCKDHITFTHMAFFDITTSHSCVRTGIGYRFPDTFKYMFTEIYT